MNVLEMVSDLLTPTHAVTAQVPSTSGDRGDKGDNAFHSTACAARQGGDTRATRGDIAVKNGQMSPFVAPVSPPTMHPQVSVSRGMSPLSPLSPSPDLGSSTQSREKCPNAPIFEAVPSPLAPPEKWTLPEEPLVTGGWSEPPDPWAPSDVRATRSESDSTAALVSDAPPAASPSGAQEASCRQAPDADRRADRRDTRYRLWDAIQPDGRCLSVSLTPPVTQAEMQAAYPDWRITPVQDPVEATDSAAR